MFTRILYYLSSIFTILRGVKNWPECITLPFRKTSLLIRLRNGLQFKVRTLLDVWIIKETCLDRDYEKHGTVIQNGWNVIDIGAALGDFLVLTACEHPTVWLLAYEPSPDSHALLRENLSLNGVSNARTFPLAIASSNGVISLSTSGEAVQHSTAQKKKDKPDEQTIEVQAISLRDVFRTNSLKRCHFLKMDCEGGEFDILLNAKPETLQLIDRICLEYHDGFTEFSHSDLVKHLQQNGYQVKITPNPVHSYLGFLYAYRASDLNTAVPFGV